MLNGCAASQLRHAGSIPASTRTAKVLRYKEIKDGTMKRLLMSALIGASIMGVLICLFGIGKASADDHGLNPSKMARVYSALHLGEICHNFDMVGISKTSFLGTYYMLSSKGFTNPEDAAWITYQDLDLVCPQYLPYIRSIADDKSTDGYIR